jgi:hypothetical protein
MLIRAEPNQVTMEYLHHNTSDYFIEKIYDGSYEVKRWDTHQTVNSFKTFKGASNWIDKQEKVA